MTGASVSKRNAAPTARSFARPLATLVLALGLAGEVAAQPLPVSEPYLLTQSGWASLGAQDYDAALSRFDQALESNPSNLSAQAGRARALAGLDKLAEALAITNRLSNLAPEYKLEDAAILLLANRPERALQQVDSAATALLKTGEEKQVRNANRDFFAKVHYLRGEALYMMQGYKRAGFSFAMAREMGAGAPSLRGIGDSYLAMNDLVEAEDAYSSAIRLRKHDGTAFHRRARVRYLRGDLEGALADFKEAEVYLEGGREFLAQYAEALLKAQNHAEAVPILVRLIKVAQDDEAYTRIVRYHLASALIDAGRPRDAEAELARLDGWSEVAVELQFQRGRARFASGDFKTAIRYYDEALKRRPGDPDLLYNRGISWLRLTEVEKALNDLSEAAVRAPGDARIRDAIGRIRLSRGEYEEALAFYDAAVKTHPEKADPLVQRANAYLSTGNVTGALDDATRALKIEPGNLQATAAAARALLAQDRSRESLDYARQLVNSESMEKEGYLLSARASIAQGQPEDALSYIEQARNRGADPSRLALLTGDAYALADRYTEALRYYEQAVALTGKSSYAIIKRADANLELGNNMEAAQDYTTALASYPNTYALYLKRGQTYKRMSMCDQATADFNAALELAPGDNTAMRERGKCRVSSGKLVSGFRDLLSSLI